MDGKESEREKRGDAAPAEFEAEEMSSVQARRAASWRKWMAHVCWLCDRRADRLREHALHGRVRRCSVAVGEEAALCCCDQSRRYRGHLPARIERWQRSLSQYRLLETVGSVAVCTGAKLPCSRRECCFLCAEAGATPVLLLRLLAIGGMREE